MIGRANDVEYGLCASVWSENSGVTHRVAQAIDVSSQYTVVVVGLSPIQGSLFSCTACFGLPCSLALQCTPKAAHFSLEK